MSTSDLSIDFCGLVDDALGIALWQADGSGPEPAATGHQFTTPIETITAHYYIASRDYIDSAARGGLRAIGLRGRWPELRSALKVGDRAIENVTIRLPLTTAGADREGEDWSYREGVETRYLQPQAALPLLLDGKRILEFAPPRLTLTEDYRGARHFAEVRIALVSDPTPVTVAAGLSEGALRQFADAFLADLGNRVVRFVVDSIQLTPQTFGGRGRTSGRYAEIPVARLEVA